MFMVTCYRVSEKGPKIGILNLIVFRDTLVVEFDFAAMSITSVMGLC
jgi:hypothetical protein